VADENPWAWMIEYDGRHAGTARLHNHVPIDRKASYAVGLNSSGLLGQGLGTEVTRLVLDFAFTSEPEGAGLHRVELRVLDFNLRGVGCYRRCGSLTRDASGRRPSSMATGVTTSSWRCSRPTRGADPKAAMPGGSSPESQAGTSERWPPSSP
jgi:RimJ/RimL family protein N-acetyltransferase